MSTATFDENVFDEVVFDVSEVRPAVYYPTIAKSFGGGSLSYVAIPQRKARQEAKTIPGITRPELAVYNALTKLGIEFEFQSKMLGGREVKGGLIADFYLPSHSLVISVVGLYWHLQSDTKARDILQRIALESEGIRTIYIDEDDANKNATWYVQEAMRGVDHSSYLQVL